MSDLTWFDIVQLLKLLSVLGEIEFCLLFHKRQLEASTTAVLFLSFRYSELFCVGC